ncbi:SDR family NAD(P)-dependent oxidoreductase [filamentous cyanobacterium LEGE 11480]|uniref:SDR family NAD(P)-dependent oxidoreductase n=2 Tax=Romeriopsis TaxID=2992131 RepID=A0A928Z387_9CYAN|nr:SDR family NAD(P)-dependent oxidoreductase [Romeriopsis navalis LEGE 11480]
MEFNQKTALVTGASRGIGRSIAIELAHQGATCLLLVARNVEQLHWVAQEIEALGVQAVPIVLDLTQSTAVDIAIAQAWRQYGPIDLLVNCAGVAYQAPFLEARREQMQAELAVNLLGMYTITQPVARRMVAKRHGKIINVSSLMGKLATPTLSTYSASKFAIVGFTQALRQELSMHNVEVSALLPSLTETDMSRHLHKFRGIVSHSPQQVAQTLSRNLNRRSAEVIVGWQGYALIWGQRLMPGITDWLIQLTMPQSLRARLKLLQRLRPKSSAA